MVFSSVEFIYFFLPIAVAGHLLMPKRLKNFWLFVTGIAFYAYGEPVFVTLLLLSCLINYLSGLLIARFDGILGRRRAVLIISVILNIGILGIFKYTGFFVNIINGIFGLNLPLNIYAGAANLVFGTHFSLKAIALPIGISFFTFQGMSYTIDLYMRNISVQRSFVDFAAYLTCFPQIVAGPIVKYCDVEDSLKSRRVTVEGISQGVSRFIRGLSKKVLLANSAGLLWDEVKASDFSSLPALTAWLGIIAFTFQIYFDFSGYSDMGIGLGKMLGFDFPENFDLPYLSKSVREFWRRWHITLGEWFRSYVYIPLGGSRAGTAKTVRNLAAVWLLTGLWHGASWNFVLWGAWFGILVILERLFLGKFLERIPQWISWLYTMLAVIFGWVLFDTPDLHSAFGFFGAMFGLSGAFSDRGSLWMFCEYSGVLSACLFIASGAPASLKQAAERRLERAGLKISVFDLIEPFLMMVLLILSTACIVNEGYNPFLYFNF